MKSGILKLMLLSIPLLPLMLYAGTGDAQTQAEAQKPAANAVTFDSGETDSAGVDAKLRPTRQLKDETAASTAPSDTASEASEAYYPPSTPSSLRYATTPSQSTRSTRSAKSTKSYTRTPSGYVRNDPANPAVMADSQTRTSTGTVRNDPPNSAVIADSQTPTSAGTVQNAPPIPAVIADSQTQTRTSTDYGRNDPLSPAVIADSQTRTSTGYVRNTTKATRLKAKRKIYTDSTHSARGVMPSTTAEVMPVKQEPLALDAKAHWKIRTGERLSEVFMQWTKVVGWQLTWEPEDLVAQADLDLEDTFTGVTGKVIDALNQGGADMQAKFYASNHMLRIMVRK